MEEAYQRVVEGLGGVDNAKAKAVHAALVVPFPAITYQHVRAHISHHRVRLERLAASGARSQTPLSASQNTSELIATTTSMQPPSTTQWTGRQGPPQLQLCQPWGAWPSLSRGWWAVPLASCRRLN
jgi:hypothetical protein